MNRQNGINRLTVMMRISDVARADIALTADRIYYRFATDDSIEDGELPPAKEDFNILADRLVSDLKANENECAINSEVKVDIFVNNRLSDINISEESLARFISRLCSLADEFGFLRGFCTK